MKSLHARARVDAHGTLTLNLPPDMAGQEVELIVVFEPVGSAKTDAAPMEVTEWPAGFFEQTAGAWQGEPLKREPQGELEERSSLGARLTSRSTDCNSRSDSYFRSGTAQVRLNLPEGQ